MHEIHCSLIFRELDWLYAHRHVRFAMLTREKCNLLRTVLSGSMMCSPAIGTFVRRSRRSRR